MSDGLPPPARLRAWLDLLIRLRSGPKNVQDVPERTFDALVHRSLIRGTPWRASLSPRARLLLAVYDLGRRDERRGLESR